MSKHTPGPWFVSSNNAGSAKTSVWARGGDVRVADCGNSNAVSLPGRQADARLIAAAPELLSVLERLSAECMTSVEYGDWPELQALVSEAGEILAKATGEQA